jgi:5-methylcytosine-specific restriction enzyme A
MLDLYSRAGRETGYWGYRYLGALKRHGGLATARRMLRPKRDDKIDAGLQKLIDAGRADELSVEAIVLRAEFRDLFTATELLEARRRLRLIPESARQRPIPPSRNHPDEVDPHAIYEGGRVKSVLVNVYERDSKARDECLEYHGYDCAVCEVNFFAVYGELGRDFIHVHHKKPLALRKGRHEINPRLDLIPVCPNCHAMLHATNPPQTVEQLQRIYTAQKLRASI